MENFDIVNLFLDASIVVQIIMVLLLIFSIYSWTIIVSTASRIKSNKHTDKVISDQFWNGDNLNELHNKVSNKLKTTKNLSGIESIFYYGLKSYHSAKRITNHTPQAVIESCERAMYIAAQQSINEQEKGLNTLSIIAGASPYIGLFGTVWGIMQVFFGLGNSDQVSLQVIAPGIAEALIATAMGLFAAIPALISYNSFSKTIYCQDTNYQNFSDEFINILQRYVYQSNSEGNNE